MVRSVGEEYEIVHGERRLRACKLARMTEIEAVVRELTDRQAYELSLVENMQRESLTPIEQARAFEKLQGEGYKQAEIAGIVGKDRSYVAHKLRLLRLPAPLQFYLQEEAVTENHMRQVMKLKGIYPPGLKRAFSEELSRDVIADERAASFMLAQIRPEGRLMFLQAGPLQKKACELFADYVSKHNAEIPQWEVAAFWWLSMAAIIPLNVADLTTGINSWQERYLDALGAWYVSYEWHEKEPPEDPEWADEYWGFWEDLKHSGSLSLKIERGDDFWHELIRGQFTKRKLSYAKDLLYPTIS